MSKTDHTEALSYQPDEETPISLSVLGITLDTEETLSRKSDGTIVISDIEINPIGIKPGTNMDQETYKHIGLVILRLRDSIQWIIGDWLAYGDNRKWGETYEQIAQEAGYEISTLYDYKKVAANVKFGVRTLNLSFTHHKLVAYLPESDQRKWLKAAEQNDWSVKELRNHLQSKPKQVISLEEQTLFKPSRRPKLTQLHELWTLARAGDKAAKADLKNTLADYRTWLAEIERTIDE